MDGWHLPLDFITQLIFVAYTAGAEQLPSSFLSVVSCPCRAVPSIALHYIASHRIALLFL